VNLAKSKTVWGGVIIALSVLFQQVGPAFQVDPTDWGSIFLALGQFVGTVLGVIGVRKAIHASAPTGGQ